MSREEYDPLAHIADSLNTIAHQAQRPIVIRSTIPRTNDEMQEARLRLGVTGWPIIVLDYHWEVIP